MPQSSPQVIVTVADLSFLPSDHITRSILFERYSKQKPTVDAIPVLRRALADPHHRIVQSAVYSLRKLGPLAREAMNELLRAAVKVDRSTRLPQAYPECVTAMAAIEPGNRELVTLIINHVGLDNWVPLSALLKALKAIGTPEAKDLLRRTAAFWLPDLDKAQQRVVEQLLAESDRWSG